MSLCINPARTGVRVNVDGGHLVYYLRQPKAEEYCEYKRSRVARIEENGSIQLVNKSEEELIKYVDKLLVDVEGFDHDGEPEDVTYYNTSNQQEEKLGPDIKNWVHHIPPAVKFQVGQLFEYVEAQSINESEKNLKTS